MTHKPESKTEEKSLDGLAGMLQDAFCGTGSSTYVTTITAPDGTLYRGSGSTPEKAEHRASDSYERGEQRKEEENEEEDEE